MPPSSTSPALHAEQLQSSFELLPALHDLFFATQVWRELTHQRTSQKLPQGQLLLKRSSVE
jgi:hypothetical protein